MKLGIFLQKLGKKDTFWHWEYNPVMAIKFGQKISPGVVDHWNNLTEEIVTAKTVTRYKTLLDKHFVNEHFDTIEIY